MIVINKINIPDFLNEREKIQSILDANFIDIIPIEILNDKFILPESVLTHEVFKKIFDNFTLYETREVNQNEFKQIAI